MSSPFEAPKNALYIILGEIQTLTSSRKNSLRWSTNHSYEESSELNSFQKLKTILNSVSDLQDIDSNTFLTPFLDIIRSEETSGPMTCLALNAVNKFLSYGLIDTHSESAASAIDKVANAVTHTRFVGTNPNNDEVVLMRILQVLRSLLLSSAGSKMTNDSVCEILQSCFRICFETRLSELLRKTSEHVLIDMVQLLFARLPQFKDDTTSSTLTKRLHTRGITTAGISDTTNSRRRSQQRANLSSIKKEQINESQINESALSPSERNLTDSSPTNDNELPTAIENATHDIPPSAPTDIETINNEIESTTSDNSSTESSLPVIAPSFDESASRVININEASITGTTENEPQSPETSNSPLPSQTSTTNNEYINPRGIRFTTSTSTPTTSGPVKEPLSPYGWPCVRGLFRFLTTLINNYDKNNTEYMMTVGLNLLTVALEVGADHIANYPLLLSIVKDSLCRNLLSMLNCNRIQLFSASLRVAFLIFESLRTHLKYQFEYFLTRLMELIVSEQSKVTYEQKEIALETIVQFLRIPGLSTELYLNYDCDLYLSNLFEELTKMLSKNAFPVAGLTSTHILSLDALLSVIDHIELECQYQVERQKTDSTSQSLTRPVSSGYALALSLQNIDTNRTGIPRESRHGPRIRQNRQTISTNLPSQDDLKKIKHDKKILKQGSELFNQSPSLGINFLQENRIFANPLEINEIVKFLKDNPMLDKKIIGEYLSSRKNITILEQYVSTFHFDDMRIDEALRIYLSEFRLPGESPLISALLEHFAAHWRKCNNFQLANNDAAFGLAYACIMLNTDQHNTNARRQISPMTCEDFKRNLSKMNNKENFEDRTLTEIYNAIKSDEIVMPAEHTGLVRESYLWKLMLKRSSATGEKFLHVPSGSYNYDIFTLVWGQTMAALSFVFEKSNYDLIIQKSIQGFSKCARIAAHYFMSDVFDNLVISLCKFTTLLNSREWTENLPIQFGLNRKARLAATVLFNIAHVHGDILRDGWKNILECIIHLYKANLLPSVLVEIEDFLDPTGRTTLVKEQTAQIQKSDIGLFSSLAFLLGGGGSTDATLYSGKQFTFEEQEAMKVATACIDECHLEQLLQETKFLIIDSLNEFLKALIYGCQISSDSQKLDQDAAVFCLELLVKVVLQNRDRVTLFWPTVRNQFYSILVNANEKSFFVERTCVGLLRIAARLLRRDELASEILASLRILLLMKPHVIHSLSSEIAFGLHELLRTNAANIHKSDDWFTLFSLLEVVGAAAHPPPVLQTTTQNLSNDKHIHASRSIASVESDSECSDCTMNNTVDKGYTSDSEVYHRPDYIVVSHDDLESIRTQQSILNQYKIDLNEKLSRHDRRALIKSCETLSFLIRDSAHVTQENFEYCIHCIRTFIEATVTQQTYQQKSKITTYSKSLKQMRKATSSNSLTNENVNEVINNPSGQAQFISRQSKLDYDDEDDLEAIKQEYQSLALQLLDLMHTLHTRASQIYKNTTVQQADQTTSSILWHKCWCPILQGIARLCCDPRRPVRSSALGYLQRSVLLPELHILSPTEWESVFNKVLFPLLLKLLETTNITDHVHGIEETRVRVSQLLCRIFLQHLSPLLTLPTFTALWLTILDFMDKYLKSDQTDMLRESVRESLKNMLLVMNTTGLFDGEQPLSVITKDRIHSFLPGLWEEVFKMSTSVSQSETFKRSATINEENIPLNEATNSSLSK
ncbi:unnamed protein product [Rotaria magnacalcarata]|uniref:SEC7 domain-containing protein n=1 Tax=Rotaria magnacalcarata TaxID=392030 RepID=A0A819LG23_9BILA|nr:unnamed protein product [Rotaria magnacalcarata]CAF3964282.1 unnamed protein product [Rotaria magnacalcarata]